MGQPISKIQESVKLLFAIALICAMSFPTYSAKLAWFSKLNQIKLLTTTREEVEKLFGYPTITYKSKGKWNETIEYKLKEGQLTVDYSLGKCSETNKEGYNVEKDVVIDVDIRLKKEVSIAKLNLDLGKFDKREIDDLPGLFTYANADFSERFTGNSEKLRDFTISPSKEQKEKFSCKNLKH